MGYKTWTAGELFTATDVNTYLTKQVVNVVTSGARPTGVEGMLIYETDTDRFMAYDGSAWVRVGWSKSTSRTGAALRRANTQSIAAGGSAKSISWDTSDFQSETFVTVNATTGTTLTVPSGCGGLYTISWQLTMASGTTFTRQFAQVTTGGISYRVWPAVTELAYSGSVTLPLADLATVTVDVFQNNAGATAVNLSTAGLWFYRIGP